MQQKLSEELIAFSSMMLMASSRGEMVRLSSKMNELVEQAMQLERCELHKKEKTLSATIKFSQEEVAKMSKTFKKEFIANGLVAHIIKRPSGKNSAYYEIRYRRNGYNISVSNKNLQRAKELFIVKTFHLDEPKKSKLTFGKLADEWLTYKKGKIADKTLREYSLYISRDFAPLLNKGIKEIRTGDIDAIMREMGERLYESTRIVINSVFKYAIASGVITHNPVTLLPFKRAKRVNRTPLTPAQLTHFLKEIKLPQYNEIRQCAYAMYFCGLRPCELNYEAHFENGFLIARNRKRKNGKVEYKKIPVPKEARGLLFFDKPIALPFHYNNFARLMKKCLNGEATSYNLRHTFASICAESVKEEVVELWMGDSPERLVGKVYIHFSDEFMREQMDSVRFPT
mgnify:CR=1 FL=1